MEKRVLLAIFLSFIVLVIYQGIVGPPPPPPASTTPAPPGTGAPADATAPATPAAPFVTAPVTAVDPAATDIVVETDAIRAVFSTAGATLTSWTLKGYLEGGQPLDLVPPNLPATLSRPFTLSTNDAALSARLASAIFQPSAPALSLGARPGASVRI